MELESGGSGGVVWRVKCNEKKLVCAVGSRNGTEETKLLVLDFDVHSMADVHSTPDVHSMVDVHNMADSHGSEDSVSELVTVGSA